MDERDRDLTDKEKALKAETPYTSKGKFHCLVTEYDLDPVVLLVASGLDDSDGFKALLSKLDAMIKGNRARRLRAFVVFLDHDKLKDVVTQDDERVALAAKVQKIADDLKLDNVVLTLAGAGRDDSDKGDLAKYDIDKSAALTAVLFKNLRIHASHKFARDELAKDDAEAIKTILGAAAEMIKPKK